MLQCGKCSKNKVLCIVLVVIVPIQASQKASSRVLSIGKVKEDHVVLGYRTERPVYVTEEKTH
jgi:hypothetical protein